MGERGLAGPGAAGRKLAARSRAAWAYLPLSLCFVLPLATNQKAVAQDFHPTMVETGLVNTDGHVAFNPRSRIPRRCSFCHARLGCNVRMRSSREKCDEDGF